MSGLPVAAMLLAAVSMLGSRPRKELRGRGFRYRRSGRAAMVAVAVSAAAVITPPAVLFALVAATCAYGIRLRRRGQDRRRREEVHSMAAALEVLIGELRVGAHPVRAFAVAASESSGVVSAGMRMVASRAQLGADVVGGLDAIAPTSSVPDYWRRLAMFWRLATEQGVAMSALMAAAQSDVIERQGFSDRMHAALAGARATAVILALLPGLGLLLGQLVGAHPLRFLLGGGLGGALLITGVALILTGLAWADRIIERVGT